MQTQPTEVNMFTEQRIETDLDLVSEVRTILCNAGLMPEVVSNFDTCGHIQSAKTLKPDAQRFLLNRFWNLQLLAAPVVTVEERFCLIPNGEHSDWLRLFKDKILPCAITNRLPLSISDF